MTRPIESSVRPSFLPARRIRGCNSRENRIFRSIADTSCARDAPRRCDQYPPLVFSLSLPIVRSLANRPGPVFICLASREIHILVSGLLSVKLNARQQTDEMKMTDRGRGGGGKEEEGKRVAFVSSFPSGLTIKFPTLPPPPPSTPSRSSCAREIRAATGEKTRARRSRREVKGDG